MDAFIAHWLSTKNLVLLAGGLHFLQIPASFMGPKPLNWGVELKRLSPLNRRIYIMIALAMVMYGFSLGLVVVYCAEEIASGSRLAYSFCFFMSLFWGYRAVVQYFVYSKVWIGGIFGRLTHYGLCGFVLFHSGLYFLIGMLLMMGG